MNAAASAADRRARSTSTATTGCTFRAIVPHVAIIRATTADERGNLSYEHEGAFLGALDQALAARNNGGIVIAQVKRVAEAGSLRPSTCTCPASWSTTSWSSPSRCRPRRRPTTRPSAARSSARWQSSIPGLGRRQGHRAPRGAGAARTAGRSTSASASRPTCRASCSRKACTAR